MLNRESVNTSLWCVLWLPLSSFRPRTEPLLYSLLHNRRLYFIVWNHCFQTLTTHSSSRWSRRSRGGGHRAAKLWIGLISGGEGSDAYISYTGVTLPDLRQISHLKQLFAITKCGIHYKRFFPPSFNIISYCSCENGKCCYGEKGIFFLKKRKKKGGFKVWKNFHIVRWNWAPLCVDLLWGRKWQPSWAYCIGMICKYMFLKFSTMNFVACISPHCAKFKLYSLTFLAGIVVRDA